MGALRGALPAQTATIENNRTAEIPEYYEGFYLKQDTITKYQAESSSVVFFEGNYKALQKQLTLWLRNNPEDFNNRMGWMEPDKLTKFLISEVFIDWVTLVRIAIVFDRKIYKTSDNIYLFVDDRQYSIIKKQEEMLSRSDEPTYYHAKN